MRHFTYQGKKAVAVRVLPLARHGTGWISTTDIERSPAHRNAHCGHRADITVTSFGNLPANIEGKGYYVLAELGYKRKADDGRQSRIG